MKALVLLSGGLDSATCLGMAVDNFGRENVQAASIFYGQRHERELSSATEIARHYGVERSEFDAAAIFSQSNSALMNFSGKNLSHETYGEQIKKNPRVDTYVSFRNGLFISIAASFADSIFDEPAEIYIGVHQDDSAANAYPDCRADFIAAIGKAVEIGTFGKIKVVAPFLGKNKADIVKIGLALKVPYELTWSCYERGDRPCGKCATCLDRAAAFAANNIHDPALA